MGDDCLKSMRKLLLLLLMFLLALPALGQDNEEAKIKAALEDRYQEWLAAANKERRLGNDEPLRRERGPHAQLITRLNEKGMRSIIDA